MVTPKIIRWHETSQQICLESPSSSDDLTTHPTESSPLPNVGSLYSSNAFVRLE